MTEKVKQLIKEMTLEEKAGMCSGFDFWHLKGVERLGIPSVMVTDGPHGLRKQEGLGDHLGAGESIKAVCFPTSAALGASFDRELMYGVGQTLGKQCQAENVSVLLGPGANIKRSPLCGRNFEYLSEDPFLSGEMAAAHIQGLQSQHIGASLKHFAANNQETRRMTSNSVVDERTLHEIYLASFEGAVKKGKPGTVMCSYNRINGTYAAENKLLLTDVLRDKWGFEGLVVTDWGAGKDRVRGLMAGLDLEMPGSGGASDAQIVAAVQNGTLDVSVLNQSVERILTLILDYTENRQENTVFDLAKGHKYATQVAAQCAVLLKNEKCILPLRKDAKVAVIGMFAKKPRYQGSGSSFINSAFVTSAMDILDGAPNVTYAEGYTTHKDGLDSALLQEAISVAKDAEVAVLFVGLPDSHESEGFDRKHLELPDSQNTLIAEICKVQPNTVVVLHNGSPIVMPWINDVAAVLEMYLGGDGVGGAAVSLLYGDTNPSGKLAETFPMKLSDNPAHLNFPGFRDETLYREGVYVGYRYYDKKEMNVLFPFGHGLSYTQFEYSDIKIDKANMTDTETCNVTAQIKNTGSRAGKEVVQLYVRDLESAIDRPVRELKGFTKVSLEAGETTTVSFSLDKRAFAYFDTLAHDWMVESGAFEIVLGSSSRDIRAKAVITIESTTEIPVVFTKYSTLGDIMATPKGRSVLAPMMAQMQQINTSINLGEGSDNLIATAMNEMPLDGMARFGGMTNEQLDGLVAMLNSK